MKLAEAAEAYRRWKPQAQAAARALDEAEAVLKAHFRRPGSRAVYGGIAYKASPYRALDVSLARAALGAKAATCEVERKRETLTILEDGGGPS